LVGTQWLFGVVGFLLQLLSVDGRRVLLEAHRFVGGLLVVLSVSVLASGTAEKVAFTKESGLTAFNGYAASGALLSALGAVLSSLVLWWKPQLSSSRGSDLERLIE
jgi:hypothetical protein